MFKIIVALAFVVAHGSVFAATPRVTQKDLQEFNRLVQEQVLSKIHIGSTIEQVTEAVKELGGVPGRSPTCLNTTKTKAGILVQVCFQNGTYIYVTNGIVTAIQTHH